MRMWMTPPETMCRKHLLGEHVELHMFVGSINKGISVDGYLNNGMLELKSLYLRHSALVTEMIRRGYRHDSELAKIGIFLLTEKWDIEIDRHASLVELHRRCPECLALHQAKQ